MFPDLKEIRAKRRSLGLSQRELAEAVGINQGTVAKIECGKMVPNYTTGRKIFEFLYGIERQEETTAGEVLSSRPITIGEGDPVKKAVRKMQARGFSTLPVVSGGRIVGRITEKILLKAGKENYNRPCRDFMGPPLPSVSENTPASILRSLLKREPLVVVAGKGGKLRGVVSRSNIF